jgi:IclR family transcriptional regulator, KDG regulon repressor
MARVPHSKTTQSPYRVQVLDRALDILRVLGERQSDCSLAELCAALKLHKSTVHRLVMVLERHRLLDKHPDNGRYRLGLRLFELGSKAIAVVDLRERSRPFLDQVLSETQETVHLCVLDEGEVLYLEKLEPQRSVRLASRVGRRVPAYCTSVGKAILAELPEAEVDGIIQRSGLKRITPNTITTSSSLKEELRKIRAKGYSVDDEENEEGVRCVGVAVRDYSGRPVAAISVSGPAFRVSKANVAEIARSVRFAARALSRELGYMAEEAASASKAAS